MREWRTRERIGAAMCWFLLGCVGSLVEKREVKVMGCCMGIVVGVVALLW